MRFLRKTTEKLFAQIPLSDSMFYDPKHSNGVFPLMDRQTVERLCIFLSHLKLSQLKSQITRETTCSL